MKTKQSKLSPMGTSLYAKCLQLLNGITFYFKYVTQYLVWEIFWPVLSGGSVHELHVGVGADAHQQEEELAPCTRPNSAANLR